ncbi:MAG: glycosyltransferase family 4 protein [Planctomycetota bacterium]
MSGPAWSGRVCLAGRSPFMGGAEVAGERLATGLRDAGCAVWRLLGAENVVADRARSAGFEVAVTPLDPIGRGAWWRHRARVRGIEAAIARMGAGVVHANDLPTARMVAPVARRMGLPMVVHHRFTYPGPGIDWFNAAGADRHVYVSRALRAELESSSPTLAKQAGVTIHDALDPGGDALGERLTTGAAGAMDRVGVLFSGQVIERKGVATLLRAWSAMPASARHAGHLMIVGDDLGGGGAYRREMERLAEALEIEAVFAGFCEDVEPWRRAAGVAVVPSHAEPLGLVVLEAMRSGVAVIGSDVGGIPEMIVDGETGLLCPPGGVGAWASAMARLIGSAEERSAMGERGRQRVEAQFGLGQQVRRVMGVYAEVAGAAGAIAATPVRRAA